MRVSAGFFVKRLVREDVDPDLAAALDLARHRDTSRLDLAVRDPAALDRLERRSRRTARSSGPSTSPRRRPRCTLRNFVFFGISISCQPLRPSSRAGVASGFSCAGVGRASATGFGDSSTGAASTGAAATCGSITGCSAASAGTTVVLGLRLARRSPACRATAGRARSSPPARPGSHQRRRRRPPAPAGRCATGRGPRPGLHRRHRVATGAAACATGARRARRAATGAATALDRAEALAVRLRVRGRLSRRRRGPHVAPPRRRRAGPGRRGASRRRSTPSKPSGHDLALVDPDLDADAAGRRPRLDEAVVDVRADRVQRDAALGVGLERLISPPPRRPAHWILTPCGAGADRARRASASSRGGS